MKAKLTLKSFFQYVLWCCAILLLLLALHFAFSYEERNLQGTFYHDGPEEAVSITLRLRRIDRLFGRVTLDMELLHESGKERYGCTWTEPDCFEKDFTHLDQDCGRIVLFGGSTLTDDMSFVVLFYDKSMEHFVLVHDDYEINSLPVDEELLKFTHQILNRKGKFHWELPPQFQKKKS